LRASPRLAQQNTAKHSGSPSARRPDCRARPAPGSACTAQAAGANVTNWSGDLPHAQHPSQQQPGIATRPPLDGQAPAAGRDASSLNNQFLGQRAHSLAPTEPFLRVLVVSRRGGCALTGDPGDVIRPHGIGHGHQATGFGRARRAPGPLLSPWRKRPDARFRSRWGRVRRRGCRRL